MTQLYDVIETTIFNFESGSVPKQNQTPSSKIKIMPRNWHPRSPNPTRRYMSVDGAFNPKPSILERIARRIIPSLNQISSDPLYWRESPPFLNTESQLSAERCGIKTDEEFQAHLHRIRNEAWQISQEFSVARWWFLKSVLLSNPFYGEIREQMRSGATIVDLGCGLGQELRFLRDEGANGSMYGVDVKEGMWDLGARLYDDAHSELGFRKLDIVDESYPLCEFKDKVDVYLLNDFLSFLGPAVIEKTLTSIAKASRVGTKVIGWAIGQDGDEESGMKVWGTGGRGTIHNSKTFGMNWRMVEVVTETKWKIDVKMMEFKDLGFDEMDCEWFGSEVFEDSIAGKPEKLMGLCFLATRVK